MIRKLIIAAGVLLVLLAAGLWTAARVLFDAENIRQTVERRAAAAIDQPVSVGRASITIWPRAGLRLDDVVVGQATPLRVARVSLSTSMRALFSRRIEEADFVIEDGDLAAGELLMLLGSLGGSDPAPAPAEGGITLVSVRTLALRNVALAASRHRVVIDLEASVDGDRAQLTSARVKSDVSTLTATGTVESLRQRKAALTLTADPLDLDGLMAFAHAFATSAPGPAASRSDAPSTAGRSPEGDVRLDLTAAKGRAAGVPFERLAAKAHLTGGGIVFEPIGFGLFGGSLAGTVTLDSRTASPSLAVKVTMNGLDMARVADFAGEPGTITGRLSGTMTASGAGADPSAALARATGRGSVSIADGTIKGLDMVRPIVLAFGKPDLAQPTTSGQAFTHMGADLALAAGVVTLSNLQLRSRDVDVDGNGTLTLAGSAVRIKGQAQLSKELTAQAGRDLVRYTADQGRVTVPATITGTVAAPNVSIDVGGLAERALTNEFKRQAETAIERLFGKKKQ